MAVNGYYVVSFCSARSTEDFWLTIYNREVFENMKHWVERSKTELVNLQNKSPSIYSNYKGKATPLQMIQSHV